MKKVVLFMVLLCGSAFAQKAILVDVVSENILQVKVDNEIKRIHLAGIELFSKANGSTSDVALNQKEQLKQETLSYMKEQLKIGSEIKYTVIYKSEKGVQKVWLETARLNYQMIRDGYALVDMKDEFLPTMFQTRMTMAMKYAQDKKIGLWNGNMNALVALVDRGHHMCGWTNNGSSVSTMTKESILQAHQDALPKAVRAVSSNLVSMK